MRAHSALLLLSLCFVPEQGSAQAAEPIAPVDSSEAIVAWIRQSAIPLRHLEAGHGFADLQPLEAILEDVRIVGLGESTHGTREFFQVKHRLLEFLVVRLGFTAFALEAAYSDAQPITDYILGREGDRERALTGQGYVAWDTEEFAAMLDWLRAYNQTVPEERKVRFYGLDLFHNEVGRQKILDFLREEDPERAEAIEPVFRALSAEEARAPLWDTTRVAAARPPLDGLAAYLETREGSLGNGTSAAELDQLQEYVRVMRQAVSLTPRGPAMTENLLAILVRERPGTKIAFWAHNGHIGDKVYPDGGGSPGHYLRRRFGEAYYGLGLDFGQGSYLARDFPPTGDLRRATLGAPDPESLPGLLARSGVGDLVLDLRSRPREEIVESWLRTLRPIHSINWGYPDSESYEASDVAATFDGILFVSETTPTRPNPNAVRNGAEGRSF